MKSIKVVCGIIWKDGQVLIARRKPEKSLGGYWEFPGGKLEAGEDAEAALVRELKEEMGMTLNNLRYYGTHTHQYDSFSIELLAYECDFVNATFELTDHDEVIFSDIKLLKQYQIAEADDYFINRLLENLD
jgi:8-oxo-dGTP diphosphatase